MDINKEVTYIVHCNECGHFEEYSELGGNPKKKNAEKYFRKNGWKVKSGETLCSDCTKKSNDCDR